MNRVQGGKELGRKEKMKAGRKGGRVDGKRRGNETKTYSINE